jgi:hypothetical protein
MDSARRWRTLSSVWSGSGFPTGLHALESACHFGRLAKRQARAFRPVDYVRSNGSHRLESVCHRYRLAFRTRVACAFQRMKTVKKPVSALTRWKACATANQQNEMTLCMKIWRDAHATSDVGADSKFHPSCWRHGCGPASTAAGLTGLIARMRSGFDFRPGDVFATDR